MKDMQVLDDVNWVINTATAPLTSCGYKAGELAGDPSIQSDSFDEGVVNMQAILSIDPCAPTDGCSSCECVVV